MALSVSVSVLLMFLLSNLLIFSEGSPPKFNNSNSHGTTFDIIHIDDLPEKVPRSHEDDRLTKRLDRDNARISSLQEKMGLASVEETRVMPLSSGYNFQLAQYLVKLKLGTKVFNLIMDTGSDLTWVTCTPENRKGLALRAMQCSSFMCKKTLEGKCSSAAECAFDISYASGSAKGIYGNVTATMNQANGKPKSLENVLIGCVNSSPGINMKGADGVMGLENTMISLVQTASQTEFAYCLVNSHATASSKLILGPSIKFTPNNMVYTQLVGKVWPYYDVLIKSIRVNGKVLLDIPSTAWDYTSQGGAIIDSGTSLTYLAPRAYNPVIQALSKPLSKSKMPSPQKGFEFCFDSKTNLNSVPQLEFVFENTAVFKPSKEGYVIDVGKVKCLGFKSLGKPGLAVIGNLMQQNNYWLFDLQTGQVGFGSSSCT